MTRTAEDHQEAEEDDLGYYPDGVKRTLTDEQIKIFRHSEIHALLRARQLEQDDAEYEARRRRSEDIASIDESASRPEILIDEEQEDQGYTDQKAQMCSVNHCKLLAERETENVAETLDYRIEEGDLQLPGKEFQKSSASPYRRKLVRYDD